MKPVNGKRRRRSHARNYGPAGDRVRAEGCAACRSMARSAGVEYEAPEEGTHAAHITAKGMGAVKGSRFDLVGFCARHHAEGSEARTSKRAAFEERYGLDLRAIADRLAKPEVLDVLARRHAGDDVEGYELDAAAAWVARWAERWSAAGFEDYDGDMACDLADALGRGPGAATLGEARELLGEAGVVL